jgi:hypothetical protein
VLMYTYKVAGHVLRERVGQSKRFVEQENEQECRSAAAASFSLSPWAVGGTEKTAHGQ